MRKHRIYCGEEFRLLSSRLSPEELICISHCAVFSDCAVDGDCELQDKANKTVGE